MRRRRGYDGAHLRHDRQETERPEDAERPQHGQGPRRREKGDSNDREIENVPAVTEEAEPIDDKLREDLNNENGKRDPVERDKKLARCLHCRRPGLETQGDGVEEDYRGYEASKSR
jgi:hypothetical protein